MPSQISYQMKPNPDSPPDNRLWDVFEYEGPVVNRKIETGLTEEQAKQLIQRLNRLYKDQTPQE
jgi:hypothetical protein